MYELEKRNVPYKIPEDYYDSQELFQIGTCNYQKVEGICSIIDNNVQKACPIFRELSIKPAFFSLYHLKTAYDAVTSCLFQLLKMIGAEKPDVIFAYTTNSYPFGIPEEARYLFFDNRESIYAHLLGLAGWKMPVVLLPHVGQPEEVYTRRKNHHGLSNKLKSRVTGWLQLHPELLALAVAFRKGGWRGFFNGLKVRLPVNENIPVLLLGGGYNWDDCKEELRSAGVGPVFTILDNLEHWLREPSSNKVDCEDVLDTWNELQLDDEFHRLFALNGIDFFPILEERLRFLVERLPSACLKAYQETAELLKSRRIGALLARTLYTCTAHATAQAAHNLGVPVIVWQHGSGGYTYQLFVNYNDLMSADVYFVFGEGVVEHYGGQARRSGTQLVPVGSASLDVLAQRLRLTNNNRSIRLEPGKKVVLYVVPAFAQNTPYISLPPFSDNHCWHTQQAILDVLARYKGYQVVVKLPSNPIGKSDLLSLYAREKLYENCQSITDECSFKDLLPLADVVVIDFPMTTLLESLTTNKPVFVVMKHLCLFPEACRMLSRRAVCADEPLELVESLKKYLTTGIYPADINDNTFLKSYGTHLDDGYSSERAVEEVLRVIKEKEA